METSEHFKLGSTRKFVVNVSQNTSNCPPLPTEINNTTRSQSEGRIRQQRPEQAPSQNQQRATKYCSIRARSKNVPLHRENEAHCWHYTYETCSSLTATYTRVKPPGQSQERRDDEKTKLVTSCLQPAVQMNIPHLRFYNGVSSL